MAQLDESPLSAIKKHFTCPTCGKFLQDPLQFTGCGHAFCRGCILGQLEGPGITTSECPVCHQPAWKKDLRPNQQYSNIANILQSYSPKGARSPEKGSDEKLPAKTRRGKRKPANAAPEAGSAANRTGKAHKPRPSRLKKGAEGKFRRSPEACQDGCTSAAPGQEGSSAANPTIRRHTTAEDSQGDVAVGRNGSHDDEQTAGAEGSEKELQARRQDEDFVAAFMAVANDGGGTNSMDEVLGTGHRSSASKLRSTPTKASPPSSCQYAVIPDTPEMTQALLVPETPAEREVKVMSKGEAAREAFEVYLILAEIQKIEGLLLTARLRATQLDELVPELGSEFVLNAACRTQRRLGDIDFEMISS